MTTMITPTQVNVNGDSAGMLPRRLVQVQVKKGIRRKPTYLRWQVAASICPESTTLRIDPTNAFEQGIATLRESFGWQQVRGNVQFGKLLPEPQLFSRAGRLEADT